MRVLVLTEIAQVYMREGDAEFNRNKTESAVSLYTKGIDVNCKDDELNVILHLKRALSYDLLGELTQAYLNLPQLPFWLSYISLNASFENLMIH